MFKRILLISTLLLMACSNVEDVPLPITTSSEKALQLYKEAMAHRNKWEGREAQQTMAAALRIDPNFILANLYAGADEASLVRQYRSRAIEINQMEQKLKKFKLIFGLQIEKEDKTML